MMIDVEYKIRGPIDARRQGFSYLTSSHYHRAYVHIKIFPKLHDGQFSAIAIVWRKPPVPPAAAPAPPGIAGPSGRAHRLGVLPLPPPDAAAAAGPPPSPAALLAAAGPIANAAAPIPVVGVPVFHAAFDFGTAPCHPALIEAYTSPPPAPDCLPGCLPPIPAAALPLPHLGFGARGMASFQLQIPAEDVCYLLRDDFGNLVPPPTNNLTIDLGAIQEMLHRTMDFD